MSTLKTTIRCLFVGLLVSVFATGAYAVPLALSVEGTSDGVKQTGDDPCIIGESSCGNNQPSGLEYVVIGNNLSEWTYQTTDWTIFGLLDFLGEGGSTLALGIDINSDGQQGETLDFFQVFIGGAIAFFYDDGAGDASTNATTLGNGFGYAMPPFAQGTGESDYILTGIDLSGYSADLTISFRAGMFGLGDGREQLFLTNDVGGVTVPEPGTLLLLGSGLIGLSLMRRRRLV